MINLFYIIIFILALSAVPVYPKPRNVSENIGGRIIGGERARVGQFPYSAAIYTTTADGTYFYSGALLNIEYILTAGQCVYGARSFTIRMGSNSLSEPSSVMKLATEIYYLHPDFDPYTLRNDIGLIRFREKIAYSQYIQPINYLVDQTLPDGAPVTTFGWGQTSDVVGGLMDELEFVHVATLSNDECRITYGSQITDNMLCVEGNYNEGTCNGDIGSPLVQYGSRGYAYHVGISSFISGNGCETPDPSGFTRTAPYRDWIRNVTSQL